MRKNKAKRLAKKYKKQVLRDIFILSQRDIDDITRNVMPLKKGDKLFVKSDKANDPQIILSAMDNDIFFEQGYASTVIFLLNIVEFGKNYLRKDSYIYPAIYCMRMYLEVIMKLILTNNHVEIAGIKHELATLWKKVKETLIEEDVDETVKGVEQVILELQQSDPKATAFRYPKKLNTLYEKRKIKDIGTLIDIRILRERFLQLYRFFDGLYDLSIVNLEKKQSKSKQQ